MSEIQKKLEERRAHWEKMLSSPDWEKYKAGGESLTSVEGAPLCYPNHSLALGLPFKEGTPDSRASWFFYQLGANGGQIASFIREMLTLDPEEQVEYDDLTATESLEGGAGQSTHVTSQLSARFQYGEQQVVILDIGSHHAKAGWAAENAPAFSFPSVAAESGARAVERGVVIEWDAYEWLIQECYRKLETRPEAYPLIFCIAPKTPLVHKVRIAKYLFETLKVPSVFFCTTSYAGLCWSEKFHGLVVNVGAGIVHTVPYYEGVCIVHAIQRSDVSGQDITANLISTCRTRGDIVSEAEAEIMKCKLYTLTPDPTAIPAREEKIIAHGFRADGAQVPLGQELTLEVVLGSEILFRPDRTQKENLGIPEMIQKTISECDIDTRKALWSNIVVCGGASMVPGFTHCWLGRCSSHSLERLQTEVSALTPGDTVAHVNCPADRLNNTHMGANNIAFYDDFYNLCITADEFAIEGENIFEEKCNN